MGRLTDRQRKFADYYLSCGIAEQAAIEAGYSPQYARGNAHKLVANSCIQTHMETRRAMLDAAKVAQMGEINEFWTRVLRGEEKEEQGIYNPKTGAVEVVSINPTLKDRIKASELRARVEGAFVDKMQLSGEVQIDDARARLAEKLTRKGNA